MSENPQPPQEQAMQPTPRTDGHAGRSIAAHYGPSKDDDLFMTPDGPFVHANFARQLERELSAANAALAEMRFSAVKQLDHELKVKLCEQETALATATAQLEEMTARATSLALHLPPETLCGDIQRWRDEAKAQAAQLEAARERIHVQHTLAGEAMSSASDKWQAAIVRAEAAESHLAATTAELGRAKEDTRRLDWLERKKYMGCSSLRLKSDHDNQVQWWTAFDGKKWHEERTARAAIDAAAQPVATPAQGEGKERGRTKAESCLDPTLSHLCSWPKCIMRADGWHSCVSKCPTDHLPAPSNPSTPAQPSLGNAGRE